MRRRQILASKIAEEINTGNLFDSMEDDMLAVAYETEFGTKPHHRMKRDTIVGKLNDARNICA